MEDIFEIVPAIESIIDNPKYKYVGIIETGSDIEKSEHFIKEENDIILVDSLFDKSDYKDYFVDKEIDDLLMSNENYVYTYIDQ